MGEEGVWGRRRHIDGERFGMVKVATDSLSSVSRGCLESG